MREARAMNRIGIPGIELLSVQAGLVARDSLLLRRANASLLDSCAARVLRRHAPVSYTAKSPHRMRVSQMRAPSDKRPMKSARENPRAIEV